MSTPSAANLLKSFEAILRHVAAAKHLAAGKSKNRRVGNLDGVTSKSTVGSLLSHKHFDELDWLISLVCLEATHNIEIPPDLADQTELTLSEFALQVSKLRQSKDPLFRTKRIVSQFIYPTLGLVVKETTASVRKRIERQTRKAARDSKKLANN